MFLRKGILFCLFFFMGCLLLHAQDKPVYHENTIGINVVQLALNEFSISLEHRFSPRRSLELSGGYVYVNKLFEKMTEDWTNSHNFSELGFSLRAGYKFYKKSAEGSRWKNYIEPIIVYKYLFYNNQWFNYERTNQKNGEIYTECFFQNRLRIKFGIDFIWGKEYSLNKKYSLEFFWGGGLRATSVERQDVLKQDTCGVSKILVLGREIDKQFYIRPTLTAGIKFRFNF